MSSSSSGPTCSVPPVKHVGPAGHTYRHTKKKCMQVNMHTKTFLHMYTYNTPMLVHTCTCIQTQMDIYTEQTYLFHKHYASSVSKHLAKHCTHSVSKHLANGFYCPVHCSGSSHSEWASRHGSFKLRFLGILKDLLFSQLVRQQTQAPSQCVRQQTPDHCQSVRK